MAPGYQPSQRFLTLRRTGMFQEEKHVKFTFSREVTNQSALHREECTVLYEISPCSTAQCSTDGCNCPGGPCRGMGALWDSQGAVHIPSVLPHHLLYLVWHKIPVL